MFFLLGGQEKKNRKGEKVVGISDASARVREIFLAGRFPVVTTHQVEGRHIAKVLGLVCCRGFDSDEAFFGMKQSSASQRKSLESRSFIAECGCFVINALLLQLFLSNILLVAAFLELFQQFFVYGAGGKQFTGFINQLFLHGCFGRSAGGRCRRAES
jgi:hypothetical protein